MTTHTYILAIDRESCDWAIQTDEGFDAVMPLILAYEPEEAVTRDGRGVVYRREVQPNMTDAQYMGYTDAAEDQDLFIDGLQDSR